MKYEENHQKFATGPILTAEANFVMDGSNTYTLHKLDCNHNDFIHLSVKEQFYPTRAYGAGGNSI